MLIYLWMRWRIGDVKIKRPSGERQSVRVPADKLITSSSLSQAGCYFTSLRQGDVIIDEPKGSCPAMTVSLIM